MSRNGKYSTKNTLLKCLLLYFQKKTKTILFEKKRTGPEPFTVLVEIALMPIWAYFISIMQKYLKMEALNTFQKNCAKIAYCISFLLSDLTLII
jgi:hypothetical protein